MNPKFPRTLFPAIKIVTLSKPRKFESPLCSTKNFCYNVCSSDCIIPFKMPCLCDTLVLSKLKTFGYCDCDCVHCRCDCDDCKCDCDHCRCDCDFCSCVSKGGYSPEKYNLVEACELHSRTFFKISGK